MVTEILPLRKAERWVLAITIVVVIAYAWLIARGLEPKLIPPVEVVEQVVWLKEGKVVEGTLTEVRHSAPARILRRELFWMQRALDLIGPFREAPTLAIHLDDNDFYRITDERIELGLNIATTEGQVFKTLLKAWLYQHASTRVIGSLLRVEVVSDFLSAVVRGQPRFSNPFSGRVDEIPRVDSWPSFASSYDSARKGKFANAWISAELQRYSGHSTAMNLLGFRPLLLAMLWELYQQTPPLARYQLVRQWIDTLTLNLPGEPLQLALPEELSEWRQWLKGEFDALMPAGGPLERFDRLSERRTVVMNKSGLLGNSLLSVPLWLFRDKGNVSVERLAEVNTGQVVIELGDGTLWLLSFERSSGKRGWVQLSARDRSQIRPEQFVWETCLPVNVGELLHQSADAEHLLFIGACDELYRTEIGWNAFLAGGLRAFARERPEVPFVQLKRSALEVALRQGKLSLGDRVGRILGLKLDPVFGLESAEWSRDLHAYRVLGAIEAIEWIRGSPLVEPM